MVADDEALKTVAKITGGEFFSAETADQLNAVLAGVKSRLGTIKQDVDLSAGFAVLGSLLLLAGALVTLRRNPLGRAHGSHSLASWLVRCGPTHPGFRCAIAARDAVGPL